MSTKLDKHAYEQLVREDIAALLRHMPASLERSHIRAVLEASIEHEYHARKEDAAEIERLRGLVRVAHSSVLLVWEPMCGACGHEYGDADDGKVNAYDVAAHVAAILEGRTS